MGRVRRYKKLKSCDPFAPRKKDDDSNYNLPPSKTDEDDFDFAEFGFTVESKNKDKRKRKIEQKWEAAVLHDKEYEKKIFGGTKNLSTKIEGKRQGESIQSFNRRVNQETAKLLIEDSKEASSSRKRNKRHLDEKKKKKKEAKKIKQQKGSREGKSSDDDGATGVFPSSPFANVSASASEFKFGETNDAPPTLKIVPKLKAGKVKHQQSKNKLVNINEVKSTQKQDEMAVLRARVMQAYSEVKKNRRGGATKFAAGNL